MPTLHWLNDEEARRATQGVPYRLLEEDPALSYGDPHTQNMLIQGDNLAALKSLLPYYAGQVKCIYIDPPYNTGSAFENYDDNLEHSLWLTTIFPRVELLRELLAEDGAIWISIDDNEDPYLRVILDELFGRKNFVASVVWQKRTSPDARIHLGPAHDYILVYAKDIRQVSFNRITLTEMQSNQYKNPDNDLRGPWVSTDFSAQGWRPNQMYKLRSPRGTEYEPPPGRCWVNIEAEFNRLCAEGRMWFGKDGNARPRVKTYLNENSGVSSWTWWTNVEVGHNQEAKKEINKLFGADNAFETPKPERLLNRILSIGTNTGELVLDSFLGSGTTAAVAHKMGRRYIGIEMGEHAVTHCVPRLKKVVDGEQGGISKAINWQGGGGFRFYRLGEPVFDENNHINPHVTYSALAAHCWFSETKTPLPSTVAKKTPLLGVYNGMAYFLLFNGILGDQTEEGGNVLTQKLLRILPPFAGPKVIYGEVSLLDEARLRAEGITFKKIPYELSVR
ncbi:MAG: site-specific DNA-methyltransferase [Anaerolinea sp.]|nr:site-specific DNA-methyltransferase [Anaerolinea sp.]